MRWVFVGLVVLNLSYLSWSLMATEEVAGQNGLTVRDDSRFPRPLELLVDSAGSSAQGVRAETVPALTGCPAIGPFVEASTAEEVRELLDAGGRQSSSLQVEGEPVTHYWVYISPFEGRQQALRKLRELHAAGIDSFVVAEGAEINAISLGSFAVRGSALGLQSRLRAAGHPALVREQVKQVTRTWIVLADPLAQGFMELIPPALLSGTRLERRQCPGA